jgi:hypothetical protein
MIYPATYDIIILQNATWKAVVRATQQRQTVSSISASGGTALVASNCHNFLADDAVVFTAAATPVPVIPCGFTLNTVYYVLSSGLTGDAFYISESVSGSALAIDKSASGTFYAAKPVNLSGYTVDADLNELLSAQQVTTFSCVVTNEEHGLIEISMTPTVSSGIEAGQYSYDVSLTSPSNERYYWLTGLAVVQRTYSRN